MDVIDAAAAIISDDAKIDLLFTLPDNLKIQWKDSWVTPKTDSKEPKIPWVFSLSHLLVPNRSCLSWDLLFGKKVSPYRLLREGNLRN
ncbi:hypothetical protein ACE6H2_016515 [Prunus campanulata]